MKKTLVFSTSIILFICIYSCTNTLNEDKSGLKSILADDLKHHLEFLAADEFSGRDTPSPELKIAGKYLAQISESYGLKTIMPDNSFYQSILLETFSVSENETVISLNTLIGKKTFHFPVDFGIGDRDFVSGNINGKIIFLGLGFQSPDLEWDDVGDLDVDEKIVIILDAVLPESHILRNDESRMLMRYRAEKLIEMGAKAVFKVIDIKREDKFNESNKNFDNTIKSRISDGEVEGENKKESINYKSIEIRHDMAAAIIGISRSELTNMFNQIRSGKQVKGQSIRGKSISINVEVNQGIDITNNVLALIEGNDPDLRDEYIVFGAHYDHIGIAEGVVYNGANDNGSGTVALLELAQAMVNDKPARSIIFVWFTGEEKGLWGSEYFVANPPVAIEKISACINLDVVSGNDLEKITVIASAQLSSELDELVRMVSDKHIKVNLDYMTDDPRMANFFFTHSDQYPFIKYGIPSVWFGSESDPQEHIHQPSDITEYINYEKIELVTRFSYLLGLELANHPSMMPLDICPEIIERGSHNQDYDWEKALEIQE
jgi:hypothetical protein